MRFIHEWFIQLARYSIDLINCCWSKCVPKQCDWKIYSHRNSIILLDTENYSSASLCLDLFISIMSLSPRIANQHQNCSLHKKNRRTQTSSFYNNRTISLNRQRSAFAMNERTEVDDIAPCPVHFTLSLPCTYPHLNCNKFPLLFLYFPSRQMPI